MTVTPHQQASAAAYLGCAAITGYAGLKVAWGLGSTLGIRDTAAFETFIDQTGGPLLALWGTAVLALLASAILLSFVRPWGRRVPRRLRASWAWLGFAIMAPIGLLALGANVVAAIAGDPFPNLTPATLISVYTSFIVLGLTLAFTAWRTRNPDNSPTALRSRPRRLADVQ